MRLPLFLVLVCSVPPASGKPLQTASPEPLSAVSGEDVVLPCRLTTAFDPSHVTVEWSRVDGPTRLTLHVLRNGEELEKEKAPEYVDRTAGMGDGSLRLLGVRRWDNGTYSCALLRGSSVEEEAFVSLTVAEVSEVNLSVRRTRANELFVLCESDGWSPEPLVSLLDSARRDLTAQRESSARPDHLFAVSASAGALTGNETFTCRVEIPAMSLVKENNIHIIDEFNPSESGRASSSSASYAWQVTGLVLVLFVVLLYFVMKRLRLMPCRHIGDKDDPGFTEYGDIQQVKTTGASEEMAKANGLLSTGVAASKELAERDQREVLRYSDDIISVGQTLRVHPALIAAIISRQSEAGSTLKDSGYGKFAPSCYGLMQINKNYHAVKGGPFSKEHMDQGVTFFIQLIKTMRREKPGWTKEQQLKGALACYIAGEDKVLPLTYAEVDSVTPYKDFANDVIARAQWFASNGF